MIEGNNVAFGLIRLVEATAYSAGKVVFVSHLFSIHEYTPFVRDVTPGPHFILIYGWRM